MAPFPELQLQAAHAVFRLGQSSFECAGRGGLVEALRGSVLGCLGGLDCRHVSCRWVNAEVDPAVRGQATEISWPVEICSHSLKNLALAECVCVLITCHFLYLHHASLKLLT